jgi:hypothetical protein
MRTARALLMGFGGILVVLLVRAVHQLVDREPRARGRHEWNGRIL